MDPLPSKLDRTDDRPLPFPEFEPPERRRALHPWMRFSVQVVLVATTVVVVGTQILSHLGISVLPNREVVTATTPFMEADRHTSKAASNAKPVPNTPVPVAPASSPLPSTLVYNVPQTTYPHSEELQAIVDAVVILAETKRLPTEALSISIIDLKSYTTAGYQAQTLRFPASISKLFWMVEFYAWMEQGLLPAEDGDDVRTCKSDICRMIQHSDNEAASRIVDRLTHTRSGENLTGEAFDQWHSQRWRLSQFFRQAGYEGLNVSQKNFPIPELRLDRPQGADLTMRGDDPDKPIRNQISAAQTAQLMADIVMGQAVSPVASQQMTEWLTRYDLQTGDWRNQPYNPIAGFLGESLPPDIYFASKVGWTSESRQEVAFIDSKDGQAAYILVVFADGADYGEDWTLFPEISRLVFDRMME